MRNSRRGASAGDPLRDAGDSRASPKGHKINRFEGSQTNGGEEEFNVIGAQVYAAPASPIRALRLGRTGGRSHRAEEIQEITLRVPQPSTYFLLWFTKDSPARDPPDRFQIEISDIELFD